MSHLTASSGQRPGVTVLELDRPPHNHLHVDVLRALADTLERLDQDDHCRAIVLVAAVQGATVGAGLGLALVADFRVTCPEARFSANFNRLGFHPGFGLSITLPRLVGEQQAALLLYTGRRIDGHEAQRIGLADVLVPAEQLRDTALDLAAEIAISAPLAVESTRETLRLGLADKVQPPTHANSTSSASSSPPKTSKKASQPWPKDANPNSPDANPPPLPFA